MNTEEKSSPSNLAAQSFFTETKSMTEESSHTSEENHNESVSEENSRTTENQVEEQSILESEIENHSTDDELYQEDTLASFKSEWIKVELEPTVTLAQLNELYAQLCQYNNCRVQLCGQKVERVDTAALQVLLAFRNRPDITVGWIEPSAELCYAAQLLGLSSQLGLPSQEPPLFFKTS
jgi:ABC-type transporter Mla MlaB component